MRPYEFDPNRTVLSLSFVKKTSDKKQAKKTSDKKQAKKTSDKKQAKKTSDKKQAKKTIENIEKIRYYLEQNGKSKTSDIAKYIGLSPARTRVLLSDMKEVEAIGGNSNRTYKLK